MDKKKYKQGEVLMTLNDLMAQDFVFWRDRLVPYGWFQNWQMHWAQVQLNMRVIRKAVKIEEEQIWKKTKTLK